MARQLGERLRGRHEGIAAADLPVEGVLPSFDGANGWLNSAELKAQSGKGVDAQAAAIMIADAQYVMAHCV